MFKVIDNIIIWEDSEYLVPEEFAGKEIVDVYGTATAGLANRPAIFLKVRDGASVEVALEDSNASGHLIGDAPPRGSVVYLREQIEPISYKMFWLVSSKKIHSNMNWINVRFNDGKIMVLCPFTMQYGVKDA